jgi:Tol biopolymer transport system component
VVAGALAAAAVVGFVWRSPGAPAFARTLGPLTPLTANDGLSTEPSISADGRLVAYASNRNEDNLDIYVQQTTGGSVIRLTEDPANDRNPSVSPDGSTVAFYSDREPQGIYIASALGGAARLLVPDGRAPRFSPDGRLIAYWTGPWLAPRASNTQRGTFVVPVDGGAPRRIAANIASAGDPVWAPDGQSLLVFGHATLTTTDPDPDWWWVPMSDGQAVRIGAFARFKTHQITTGISNIYPIPQSWTGAGVYFTAATRVQEARNLWLVGMDTASGRLQGPPTQLTNGTTIDAEPTASPDDRVFFSAQTGTRFAFALNLDADRGRPAGLLRPVIKAEGRTSVSLDGRLLALPRYEVDKGGLWLRSLETGEERQLAATPRTPLNPVLSPDGRRIAYTVTKVDTGGNYGFGEGYVMATERGLPQRLCEPCIALNWTRDNRYVVVIEPGTGAMTRIEPSTGERVPLASFATATNELGFDRPMFGPNGRWFTVNTPGAVVVSPLRPDRATTESEWTTIIDTRGAGRSAGLSPDGRLLYVLLEQDGFRCLYAIALDPETGQRSSDPFIVAHFHDPARQWGSTGQGSAVAKGVFIVELYETTGNIWTATINTRPGPGSSVTP